MITDIQKTVPEGWNHPLQTPSLNMVTAGKLDHQGYIYSRNGFLTVDNHLAQHGTIPSLSFLFIMEFPNTRASCTLPGHFITTSKKQYLKSTHACTLMLWYRFLFMYDVASCFGLLIGMCMCHPPYQYTGETHAEQKNLPQRLVLLHCEEVLNKSHSVPLILLA